jgi:recombination protein RecT
MSEEKSQDVVIAEFLEKAKPRFELAPEGIKAESEISYAAQLLTNNSYLMKVAAEAPKSLLSAMSNVASIGLSLNPAKAQAYLIPRKVKVASNKWESRIFLDPSYRGLCDIATGTGCVEWVQAKIVREGEKFVLRSVNEPPVHEQDPFKKERGEVVGAYCVAKLPSGDYLTEAMSIEDLNKIRDASEAWKSNQSGPWKDWPEEMMKKSVVRRAFKMWPKAKEFERVAEAVHLSNENEGIEMVTSPEIKDFTADQKHYYDQLIENGDDIGMFLFTASLGHGVQTSLYNSFPSRRS